MVRWIGCDRAIEMTPFWDLSFPILLVVSRNLGHPRWGLYLGLNYHGDLKYAA